MPTHRRGYVPPEGFIPNPEVASQVAKAILVPIYGEAQIKLEMPFRIQLRGDVWVIDGREYLPKNVLGGYVHMELSRRDGRVLCVMHYM